MAFAMMRCHLRKGIPLGLVLKSTGLGKSGITWAAQPSFTYLSHVNGTTVLIRPGLVAGLKLLIHDGHCVGH